ncbi:hypothetical protein BYT27DRAFT_7250404 [Phlegmacium glaucopus]|nr:hypothetical protein BYT27DRAFT_7250404 [Phlegmacium glaucopus]
MTLFIYHQFRSNPTAFFDISIIRGTVTGFCDFIAQSILIYRCWIVWGCNIHVVILPSNMGYVLEQYVTRKPSIFATIAFQIAVTGRDLLTIGARLG